MIKAQCACGQSIKTKDENAGKKARCPACGELVRLPGAAKPAAAEPRGKSKTAAQAGSTKAARRKPPPDEEPADDEFEGRTLPELAPRRRKKASGEGGGAAAKGDESTSNNKLAIGIGVGLGVLLLIGLVVIALPSKSSDPSANASAQIDPPKLELYTSERGELACLVPSDWELTAAGGGSKGIPPFARWEKKGMKIDFRAHLAGSMMQTSAQSTRNNEEELPDELKPVSTIHEFQKRRYKEEISGYEEQGAPEMIKTVGFGEGRISVFTANEGLMGKCYGYRVTLLGNDNQWNVICRCPAGQWKAMQPFFRQVIESARGF